MCNAVHAEKGYNKYLCFLEHGNMAVYFLELARHLAKQPTAVGDSDGEKALQNSSVSTELVVITETSVNI